MSGANVSGPEIIRGFRADLARFASLCGAALGSHANELQRTYDWLRSEQLPHWKRQAQRREEAYQEARRKYLEAEAEVAANAHSRGPGKPSSFEEKLDMDKARRLRDEAEERLAAVRRWVARLDHEAGPLIARCQASSIDLDDRCKRALAQLERMAERVQDYLDLPSGGTGHPPRSTP